MSDHPEFTRIETDRGVVWRFRQAPRGGVDVTMSVMMSVVAGVPLAEAVIAVVLIVRDAGRTGP